jgi:hypothetical protein
VVRTRQSNVKDWNYLDSAPFAAWFLADVRNFGIETIAQFGQRMIVVARVTALVVDANQMITDERDAIEAILPWASDMRRKLQLPDVLIGHSHQK